MNLSEGLLYSSSTPRTRFPLKFSNKTRKKNDLYNLYMISFYVKGITPRLRHCCPAPPSGALCLPARTTGPCSVAVESSNCKTWLGKCVCVFFFLFVFCFYFSVIKPLCIILCLEKCGCATRWWATQHDRCQKRSERSVLRHAGSSRSRGQSGRVAVQHASRIPRF